jgi:hypothetical protein
MNAATLYDLIAEVCPVVSTSVGVSDDRETWSYIPGEGATTEQIAAADNVIATAPVEIKTTVSSAEFIGRFTNAEYRAATATTWRQTAGNAKNWDVVVFDGIVNFNKKKTVTLRDSLVADGILTETRASEIFS